MMVRNAGAILMMLALLGCGRQAEAAATPDCRVATYRLADGRMLDLAPSTADRVRWRLMDGSTGTVEAREGEQVSTLGWTGRPGPHRVTLSGCEAGRLAFDGVEGVVAPLQVTDTTFESEGVVLVGRLVMPPGEGPAPVIVMIGGSETDSSLVHNFRQRLYPAQGVGVFVYDKRGTGGSGGAYTEDVRLLGRDAAAAAREARRLAGARLGRVGYLGGSEGGIVAPLAQTVNPTDFVIVEYGLAIPAKYIDRDLIVDDLRRAGHGPDIQAKGAAFGEAIAVLVASDYKQGWSEFFDLRNQYRREPWFADVEGDYADAFARTPALLARVFFPLMDVFTGKGVDWNYDPASTLRAITAPQLWIITGADTTSPQDTTRVRLAELQRGGLPLTMVDFPNADHGAVELDGPPDGAHPPVRYAAGYLDAALDFARSGVAAGPYGTATVRPPLVAATTGR